MHRAIQLPGRALRSGMRGAHTGADQSASAAEQDGRKDARMWVLVSLGPESSTQAKADEGSDQHMAFVACLPPHSPIASTVIVPTARISDPVRNQGDRTTLGKRRLAIAGAACDVLVLGVGTAGCGDLFCSPSVVCSSSLFGLRTSTRQCTQDQQKGGEQGRNDLFSHGRRLAAIFEMGARRCDTFSSVTIQGDGG
jgi:hypothetical protein